MRGLAAPRLGLVPPMRGLRSLPNDELVFERLRNTSPRPHPAPMLGLLGPICGEEPKASIVMRGELAGEALREGDAEGEPPLMELVPSEGDLKRKRCTKVGVDC
jgi:hypothetical protein